MEEAEVNAEICRVCRCEATGDRPLYHPCVCTGSIRYIHQECLLQWLKYSRKEYCELCKHRFSFTPIYSPDMPRRLPVKDIITGLLSSVLRAVRYWFHYTLVAFAWLGVVPLTACRIYRSLFTGSVSSLLTLPLDMLSTENLMSDCLQGCFVVTCTFCAFISLVWLREQILNGGAPEWLENDNQPANQQRNFLDLGIMNNLAGFGMGARVANQNNIPDANAAGGGAGAGNDEQDEDGADGAGNDGAQNAAQDDNWNPIEWDRAAEELTWERLLGLDGSLVFLEHVFWVVSLNTLFILVFAFFPYHIGHFTLIAVNANDAVVASHFEGLLTSLAGYLTIALSFISMYLICSLARLKKFQRLLGLCYMVVKVKLLVVIEIGLFPLVCGWWLDICSMSMFDATLKDRRNSFHMAPGTSMFIHWLVGMVYVFYFASFILLLREVLRPGVLWFLQNLNDPDFNPIHEMIHLPVYRHIRRFVASVIIFGSTVLLMLWLPIQVIRKVFPGFLPYNVILSSDAPVSELSLELLLLQVILPALLEQGHTRFWLKGLVSGWTAFVAWLLDLRSYLIGDAQDNVRGQPGPADPPNVIPAHAPPLRPEILPPPEPLVAQVPQGELVWPEPPAAAAAAALINPEINNATAVMEEQDVPLYQNEAGQLSQQEQQQPQAVNRYSWFHQTPQWNTEPGKAAGIEQDLNPDQPGPHHGETADELPAAEALYEQLPAPDEHIDDRVAEDIPDVMPEFNAPQNLQALELPALPAPPPAPPRAPPATVTYTYKRPNFFAIRILLLLVLMSVTLFTVSLISLTLPVFLGRCIMSFWMGEARNHELYTAACGLYLCWLTLRIGTVLYNWIPQGSAVIFNKLHEWGVLTLKSLMIAVLLVGVIPLQLGLLFEMVIIIPLRVPLDHTPVFFPWQDWALGILHAKMICGITMMGPQWWLKRILEQVYNDGLRNMNLAFILTCLCLPVIGVLGMALTVPYIIAESVVPAFGPTFDNQNLVQRRIYPFLVFLLMLVVLADVQLRQFKRLYEHIKNDKYLVGQRLVNYNPLRLNQENRIVPSPS